MTIDEIKARDALKGSGVGGVTLTQPEADRRALLRLWDAAYDEIGRQLNAALESESKETVRALLFVNDALLGRPLLGEPVVPGRFTAIVDQTAPSPTAMHAAAQMHRDVAAMRRGENPEED
jgi:hypothetical protein